MDTPENVQQLVDTIQSIWTDWETLIKQVPHDSLTQPGAAGDWSLKDIIAHITWFEKEMVGLISAHALVGSGAVEPAHRRAQRGHLRTGEGPAAGTGDGQNRSRFTSSCWMPCPHSATRT